MLTECVRGSFLEDLMVIPLSVVTRCPGIKKDLIFLFRHVLDFVYTLLVSSFTTPLHPLSQVFSIKSWR